MKITDNPKKLHTFTVAVMCFSCIKFNNETEMNAFRYDRQRLVLKEIHNCQYITCMNPTAGSFSINPRLQVSLMCLINDK